MAGRWRGRRIVAPSGDATRPTSDRVREAVFSILGARVADARVLDLFAGSGALGLEALSRGAAAVTFVDAAPAAVRAVRDNLATLGGEADVVLGDALTALGTALRTRHHYDLVLLDPPYRRPPALAPALGASLGGVVAAEARVVVESDRRDPLDLPLPLLLERRYGDTLIRIHTP